MVDRYSLVFPLMKGVSCESSEMPAADPPHPGLPIRLLFGQLGSFAQPMFEHNYTEAASSPQQDLECDRCRRNWPGGDPQGSGPRSALCLRRHGVVPWRLRTGGLQLTCPGRGWGLRAQEGTGLPGAAKESLRKGEMETGAQVSGLISFEDEGPLSEMSQLPLRRVLQHSTLEEATLSGHRQSLGGVPSPLPARTSWDLPSLKPGLSPKAAHQERQPSNVWASGASSGRVGPDQDPWAPEEDMPTSASGAWPQQQGKSVRTGRRPRNLGLPGIPSVAGRRRRDLKKLAAAMERVRQWEAWLLQSIEDATQHELTIQDC
ncbi:hypothetical protein MC885_018468 [Smutsia gigantea]|nr:hypothetical protein MC885_018468 [Smutsia gigantea]